MKKREKRMDTRCGPGDLSSVEIDVRVHGVRSSVGPPVQSGVSSDVQARPGPKAPARARIEGAQARPAQAQAPAFQ